MTTATLYLLLPEMVLIAVAVAIYLGGAFSTARQTWRWMAAGAIVAAAVLLWRQHAPADGSLSLPLHFDQLACLARWLALCVGVLLLLLASRPNSDATAEYVGSLLLTVAGLMLVGVAGDLVLLFVALELISIPTYVLLYLGRRDAASQEAAAKYFFLSVLSSAILLYGFSFLYGIAGSTELTALRSALDGVKPLPNGFAVLAKLALALVFGGLSFRIAAVPFHFYAPDVYQGTTHSNAALLSVVPKAAGFLVMTRILVAAMPNATPYTWQIVLGVSVLTMTFGNVMALWQDDLRRLLAYSSIANAGYMLLALSVALVSVGGTAAWDGIAAVAFYLVVYSVATIGAFAVFEHLGRPDRSLDGVDELAGLGSTKPPAAAVLAVCLFSLTGIPPLAGFWGKFLVFGGALSVDPAAGTPDGLRWWFVAAAIVGVLNAAVAAAYYLRIVAVMYFRTPLATPRAEGGAGAWWAAVTCALVLVGVGVYPGPLMHQVVAASEGQAKFFGAKPPAVTSEAAITEKRPPLQSAP
ncbi:MAG: NADH-quinone oxidoreductase subunit N [Thermoguttaceae bacterium]|jgi:NADH-quinone oxidoreductase subunit N